MDKNLINDLVCPEKTITSDSGITVHLRGVDFPKEQWIEAPKSRNFETYDQAEKAGSEVFSRMMRSIVRKVEGVYLKIDEGKEEEWTPQYDVDGLMDLQSYTILMRVLNQDPTLITLIQGFYESSTNIDKFIELKKK